MLFLNLAVSVLFGTHCVLAEDIKKEPQNEISEYDSFVGELKDAVDVGKISEKEAMERYLEFVKKLNGKGKQSENHNFPKSAFEYAKLVEPELGIPPKVDLGESVEIPLYKNGKKVYGDFGVDEIDNPTRLGKQTFSGSTLQRYEGKTAGGEILPNVVWISFGRNNSPNPKVVVGSVQMIGYNQKSGATAFFESNGSNLRPWVSIDKNTLRMRGVMPGIDEPKAFNQAYVTPGNIQCVECHQNDPFIHNSFIDAAKMPGTKLTVVPKNDEESPYYVIGGENWDMRTLYIKDNGCFECHRVGMKTLELFVSNGWEVHKNMPPRRPGSLKKDFEQLLQAWLKGPEKVDGAEWVIPPANNHPQQVVGNEYPHKSKFNKPIPKIFSNSKKN